MKEETKKLKSIMKSLSSNAEWIGEDGWATCVSSSERGAWIKFRRLMSQDVGVIEANEMKENGEVGIGWLSLVTKKDIEYGESEEGDWCVSVKNKTPYEVWVYSN